MAGTGREFVPTFQRLLEERGDRPALVFLEDLGPSLTPEPSDCQQLTFSVPPTPPKQTTARAVSARSKSRDNEKRTPSCPEGGPDGESRPGREPEARLCSTVMPRTPPRRPSARPG